MMSELQILELLATNLYQLKTFQTLEKKCNLVLDTLRRTGWAKVSLSFINSKYETKKTLYAGFTPEMIQIAEENKLPATKRKELLSSTVDRWRIPPFYYLPWRDERARLILSNGIKTEIPIHLKNEWHKRDLLYAPIYLDARPVAILNLDEPRDLNEPNKVNLRVPTILHSILNEIISSYYNEEFYKNFRKIQQTIIDKGTIGIIELSEENKIKSINIAVEQLLQKSTSTLLNVRLNKIFEGSWYDQLTPILEKAVETLEPQTCLVTYLDSGDNEHHLEIQLMPIHKMYDYSGMICTVSPPEKSEISHIYRQVLSALDQINTSLRGDLSTIQTALVKLMCQQYGLIYPRLYVLSDDLSTLKCLHSYDPRLTDLQFFDHAFNRNSLAANAILENQVLFTSTRERTIRDLRRIWDFLGTKAALAIPININSEIKAALVCDVESPNFFLDEAKKIILTFYGNLISMTFKATLKSKPAPA